MFNAFASKFILATTISIGSVISNNFILGVFVKTLFASRNLSMGEVLTRFRSPFWKEKYQVSPFCLNCKIHIIAHSLVHFITIFWKVPRCTQTARLQRQIYLRLFPIRLLLYYFLEWWWNGQAHPGGKQSETKYNKFWACYPVLLCVLSVISPSLVSTGARHPGQLNVLPLPAFAASCWVEND